MTSKTTKRRRQKGKRKKQQLRIQRLFFWLMITVVIGAGYFFALNLLTTKIMTPSYDSGPRKEDFIDEISDHAQKLQKQYGILPSIIISQAILESDWGQSQLGREYNNLYGIKAYGQEEKIGLLTKEFVDNKWIEIVADFRVYPSWEASMEDHAQLFINGVSWNPQLYEKVVASDNYLSAAQALQEAGYATDPTYAQKIIKVIETYNLNSYD